MNKYFERRNQLPSQKDGCSVLAQKNSLCEVSGPGVEIDLDLGCNLRAIHDLQEKVVQNSLQHQKNHRVMNQSINQSKRTTGRISGIDIMR